MDKQELELTLLLGALHYCANELIKIDPDYKQKLNGVDAIIQWKSVPNGPNTYTIIKNSKIEFKANAIHQTPTYTLSNKSLAQAIQIFKGIYLISNAIKKGDVDVIGDKEKALSLMFYLEDLVPYLGELTGAV
jgi:hypothetical protein